jgi:hypothetical protein
VPDADAEVLLKSDPHAVVVADGATKTVQPAEQPLTEYVSILEDLANIELDLLSMNQLSVYYEKLGRKVPRPINKRSLIQLIDERCSEITNELEAIK